MYVIPAIDLRKGKCVRLIQGEYHRQITYQDDPVKQGEDFIADGAEWLHIIDLDGAKVGASVNTEAISAIASLGKLKIEVGGGIRDEETIQMLLDLGIERVIVGTRAVEDFEWLSSVAHQFENKIVFGLDARGSKVATHGWTQESPQDLYEFAMRAATLPLAAIIYTDISKDGMLAGPNLERTKALVKMLEMPVIAAGGVNSVEDITNLKVFGVEAAVIGRALYEGTITLKDAIAAAK